MPRRAQKRCIQFGIILLCSIFFMFGLYPPLYAPTSQREVMVQGWEVNVSRRTADYVQPDNWTSALSWAACPPELLLLVVVCSAPANREQRNAIRETWASLADDATRVMFLLGEPEYATMQASIVEESSRHEDIIQEGFVDSYNNLTIKSVMMLKWVAHNCASARFLVKTDDDIYLNLPPLVEMLGSLSSSTSVSASASSSAGTGHSRGVLLGTLICHAKPIQDSTNKWYSPQYMFNEHVYPNYLSGTGYLMSRDVVTRLYKAALATPIFHLEDVYITGICARAAGVKPRNHRGFSYERRRVTDSCGPSVFTNHRLSPDDLRAAFGQANCSSASVPPPASPPPPAPAPAPSAHARLAGKASAQCH